MIKTLATTATLLALSLALTGCAQFAAFEAKQPKNPPLNSEFCQTNYQWCFNPQGGGSE